MTLLEKIAALPEITPQEVQKVLTFEDFRMEILEVLQTKEPNLDSMSVLFGRVDELYNAEVGYNIFSERLGLKTLYLSMAYDMDIDLLQALVCVLPLVKVDKKLAEILAEEEYFPYIEEAFKEYKINNGMTLSTIMKYLNTLDLTKFSESLAESIGELKNIADIK